MYILTVDLTIAPGHLAAFVPLMLENAGKSRDEPGCRQFDVCRDPTRPESMLLYEVYDDEAAFRAHLQTPHFKAFDHATAAMIAAKQARFYQRLDG